MSLWLAETLSKLLSSSVPVFAAAAKEFLLGCFMEPDESLSYETRARWLGELLIVPPETRVFWEAQTRQSDVVVWDTAIRTAPVLVIQGRKDKCVDSEKMHRVFRQLLGVENRYGHEWSAQVSC